MGQRTGWAHFMPGGQDGVLSTGPWKGGWQRTSRSTQADKGRCRGPGTGQAQQAWGQRELTLRSGGAVSPTPKGDARCQGGGAPALLMDQRRQGSQLPWSTLVLGPAQNPLLHPGPQFPRLWSQSRRHTNGIHGAKGQRGAL